MRLGSAKSAWSVSNCFLAWFDTASRILDPILGTSFGSSSGTRLAGGLLEDAAAAMVGMMSVVSWRATALVPSWNFFPVGVKRPSIYVNFNDFIQRSGVSIEIRYTREYL